ncbi:MAG: O-antigen ligase family protein [Candidatus Krumholzibacteriota bacterium]|nr:O-antigen ligase family protein [Candidatus Krumholzibacteriota bacterium]
MNQSQAVWSRIDRTGYIFLGFSLLVIVALFRMDRNYIFAIPVLAGGVLFFRRPSIIIYPLILFAFLRLDAWMSTYVSLPFGKIIFLLSFLSIAVTFLLTGERLNSPGAPVVFFVIFLVTGFLTGMIEASRQGIVLWLEDTLYAASYFFIVYLAVNSWGRLEKIIFLVMVTGIIASLLNFAEFFDPAGIAFSHSSGRAAGFLKNANTSAFVINLAMITSIYFLETVRQRWKAISIVLAQTIFFFGVFTTFSREGLMLATLIFTSQFAVIRRRGRRGLILIVAGVIVTAGLIRAIDFISTGAAGDVRYSFQKISSLAQGDFDDNDRFDLLKFHLNRFRQKPLTGHGLYSALTYSIQEEGLAASDVPNGPHNTFVMILSEAGFIPLLAYLALIGILFLNLIDKGEMGKTERGRAMRACLLMLLAAFLIHHWFSHMMLLARFSMVLVALFSLPARVRCPDINPAGIP